MVKVRTEFHLSTREKMRAKYHLRTCVKYGFHYANCHETHNYLMALRGGLL